MPREYAPEEDSLFHVLQEQPDLLIRVRQRRTALKVLLLPAFIIFWCHALMQNLELRPKVSPFDLSWMAIYGLGLGWIVLTGAWLFFGFETLLMADGDLEVGHHLFSLSKRWRYKGSSIRRLTVAPEQAWPPRPSAQNPFFRYQRGGSIRFDYGARTYSIAAPLFEADARRVVDLLKQRLPEAAAQPD